MASRWRKVGKIKEAHGLKGELQVLIFAKEAAWAKSLKEFALASAENENEKITLPVERVKAHKEGLILKPENISDRTQAEKFKGFLFFVPEELFQSKKGETIFLSEIQNFQIANPEGEIQGRIVGFASNMAQDLLVVEKAKGGTSEIPFVKEFIVGIDFESQVVKMNLPEGIWDLEQL